MSELLTLQEAADLLRVHYMTVYHMVHRRELKAAKVGRQWRIRRSDLEAYLESVSPQRQGEAEQE